MSSKGRQTKDFPLTQAKEVPLTKVRRSAAEALAGRLRDGMTIAVGGFGLSGNPFDLIEAVRDSGVRDLVVVSNNMGVDGQGLGLWIEAGQVRKVIASYVGENRLFAERYLAGELEIEFTPQGTLAERLRAGGAGIPGFYTGTGVGTEIAVGKPHAEFDGRTYLLERGIVADLSLVRAYQADTAGNLVYRYTARNFNPVVAAASRWTIAEVDEILEPGALDPNVVVTPGIFVRYVIPGSGRVAIEQSTDREQGAVAL